MSDALNYEIRLNRPEAEFLLQTLGQLPAHATADAFVMLRGKLMAAQQAAAQPVPAKQPEEPGQLDEQRRKGK